MRQTEFVKWWLLTSVLGRCRRVRSSLRYAPGVADELRGAGHAEILPVDSSRRLPAADNASDCSFERC